jgi:hypothetical protein
MADTKKIRFTYDGNDNIILTFINNCNELLTKDNIYYNVKFSLYCEIKELSKLEELIYNIFDELPKNIIINELKKFNYKIDNFYLDKLPGIANIYMCIDLINYLDKFEYIEIFENDNDLYNTQIIENNNYDY